MSGVCLLCSIPCWLRVPGVRCLFACCCREDDPATHSLNTPVGAERAVVMGAMASASGGNAALSLPLIASQTLPLGRPIGSSGPLPKQDIYPPQNTTPPLSPEDEQPLRRKRSVSFAPHGYAPVSPPASPSVGRASSRSILKESRSAAVAAGTPSLPPRRVRVLPPHVSSYDIPPFDDEIL